jgi:hypothetical protein
MTHDPYQTHAMFGAYSGLTNPFSSPYAAMQTSAMNPATSNPLAGNAGSWGVPQGYGIPTYGGISPQQLQLASALASQAAQMFGLSPLSGGWQQNAGWQQNPYLAAGLQGQGLQQGLQQGPQQNPQQFNPLLNPVLAGQQIGLNPLLAGQQQIGLNPYNPQQQIGHLGSVFGQQQVSPYAQYNNPFGQQQVSPFAQYNNPFVQPTLAPQSWVGQAGQAGGFGGGFGGAQANPLFLQAVARAIQQTQGINPWAAF